jgi:hypothetical protein
MTRWEYQTYTVVHGQPGNVPATKREAMRVNAGRPKDFPTWLAGLNELGTDGWEAVSTVQTGPEGGWFPGWLGHTVLLLKRPVAD